MLGDWNEEELNVHCALRMYHLSNCSGDKDFVLNDIMNDTIRESVCVGGGGTSIVESWYKIGWHVERRAAHAVVRKV